MKNKIKYYFFLVVLIAFSAKAQTNKVTTYKLVAEKNYVFVATLAIPMNTTEINNVFNKMSGVRSGGSISLSGSGYELKVMPDTVISYLPYYGRSFTAPIGNNDSGIKFTSTEFSYETEKTKKGWQITMAIKDTKDSEKMFLNIGENGYATLNINTSTKQAITYNGYIAEQKK